MTATPAPESPPAAPQNELSRSRERLLLAVLLLATVFSRWMVRAEYLPDWDAAQFAAAMDDYDVSRERPHGPGNPLLIAAFDLGRLAVGDDHMESMVAANVGFTLLALALTWSLVRRTPLAAWRWMILLACATNPVIWNAGATSSPHVAEWAAAVAVALIAWNAPNTKSPLAWAALLGAAMGLAAGLRPQLLALLAPLAAWGLLHAPATVRMWLVTALAGALVCLGWAIPMVRESGGLNSYLAVASLDLRHYVAERSLLFGNVGMALRGGVNATIWLLCGLGALLIVPALPGTRVTGPQSRITIYCLVWALPFAAFHCLVFISRGGFWMPALVPIALLLVLAAERRGVRPTWRLAAAVAGLNAAAFLFAPALAEQTAPLEEASGPRAIALKMLGRAAQFSRAAIRANDEIIAGYLNNIPLERDTLVVTEFDLAFTWRQAAWYLAGQNVWGIHLPEWDIHRPGTYERERRPLGALHAPGGVTRVAWIGLHAPRAEDGAAIRQETQLPHGRLLRVYDLRQGRLVLGEAAIESSQLTPPGE